MASRLGIVPHVLGLTLALAASGVTAQDVPPVRVRGEITTIDGQLLTVRTREGTTERVELAPEAKVLAVVPAELGVIAPGTFVGTAAVPRPDGRLMALEVVVFPEGMRGTGEGHYGWDLAPESTMTNATVYTAEAATDGRALTLRYPEGEKTVVVPPQAPVVRLEPQGQRMRSGASRRHSGKGHASIAVRELKAWPATKSACVWPACSSLLRSRHAAH